MRKVLAKVIACYVISAVSIMALLNILGLSLLQDSLVNKRIGVLREEAELIGEQYVNVYYNDRMTKSDMLTQLKVADTFLNTRIWVVNFLGNVVADTRPYRRFQNFNILAYDPDILDKGSVRDVYFEDIFSEPMLCVSEPVLHEYSIRAYVCMFVPMADIENEAVYYLNFVNICFLVFMIILALIFMYIFWVTVVPIRRIRKAAMEYASGNFDYPMKVKSHDEFRDLAKTMEYMVGELKNMDDYQKKFIANISHDFRSPLTSIKGYAEAMIDGTIPYDAQRKYLGIILFETDRLSKLTSNLLDLNRIDSKGMLLDISEFDLNGIIKNTVAAFEGICIKKKVMVNLEFSEKETYVSADMSRIQQVMYNLVDNAVKFSNQDSDITIITEEKGTKVLVTVKDSGIGIPKDSLMKIWDRFYKSDTSRGKDKKGTGLGLSIVKEIITAHNENINVVSTEGVGTEFTFALPLAER